MDGSALQNRLDTIEQRQRPLLSLLVGLYLIGGAWLLVDAVPGATVWTVGVSAVVLGLVGGSVGLYRRRRAR